MSQVNAAGGYSAQFSQFVSFAEDRTTTAKSIARFDEQGLNGRNINAIGKGKVGGFSALFRSKTEKDANNVARDLFRTSVLAMFHNDMRLVPESVRKAMLLSDYGGGEHSTSGKPLTARRILAVRQAVDSAKTEIDIAVQDVKVSAADLYSGADGQTKAALDDLIETAVMCCGGDKEALDIVKANARLILKRGDAELRSPDDMKSKINGIVANLNEIRTLAKNKPFIYEAAKQMLCSIDGKSFPPGMLKQIFDTVGKYDITHLKSLSPASSGPDVHRAFVEYQSLTNKAQAIPGMERMGLEAGAKKAFVDFVGALLIAKCGSSAVAKMGEAFGTEKMAKIFRFYTDVHQKKYALGVSQMVEQQMSDHADNILDTFSKIKGLVERQRGIPAQDDHPLARFPTSFTNDMLQDIDGGTTLGIMASEAEKALQEKWKRYVAEVIPGNSQSANAMRDVYARKVAGVYDVKGCIVSATQKLIKEKLQGAIDSCTAEGQAPEIHRMDVRLPGDRRLSGTFDVARNELTQFVSGHADVTFEGADEVTKNKVRIVMALLGQAADSCFDGYATGLDPDNSQKMVDIDGRRNISCGLNIVDGILQLTFEGTCDITSIRTDQGNVPTTNLSLKVGFSLLIPDTTLNGIVAKQFPVSGEVGTGPAHADLANCSLKPSISVMAD